MAADFSWTPPLAVLVLGAVAGAILVARGRRSNLKSTPAAESPGRADLQRDYDAIIRRLAEGGSPEERAALEIEAAGILKKMETGATGPAPEVAAAPRAESPRPVSAMTGFLYGAITMSVLGSLVFFASQGSTERPEGGSPTGGNSTMAGAPTGPGDAEIAALEQAVQQAPTNIAQRIQLTRAYVERRDLMRVFDETKAILEIEPGNPQALTYQALVRVAMGQADLAESMLVEALEKDPRIEEAYIHLALARFQQDNRQGAEDAIREAQRLFPEDHEQLEHVFEEIAGAAESGEGMGAPADHPETAAAAAPAAAPAGSSAKMVVVVDLAKGVSVSPEAVLFVIVREAGFEAGPPVAVKRLAAPLFPVTVTISELDSMAGESLPGLVRIDARIDSDGDPLTKDPNDPVANEDNVRPGGGQTLMVLGPGQT